MNPIQILKIYRIMNKKEIFDYLLHQNVTRLIKFIIVHCSATKPGVNVNVDIVDGWHKNRGFKKQPLSGRVCGYHFLILPDGTIQIGRYLNEIGAHVEGFNKESIGICYVGGLDAMGKISDTRTDEQKESLLFLLREFKKMFPDSEIAGHRDFSPDKNGNGKIEPFEWVKGCPSFNAKEEYQNL